MTKVLTSVWPLVLLATACGAPRTTPPQAAAPVVIEEPGDTDEDDGIEPPGETSEESWSTPSGLHIAELEQGTGEAAESGSRVVVHYTGWLEDDTKFDSSRDRDRPFEFVVGAGSVIKGFDEGVVGMKVGGRRRLILPPSLGYGERGAPPKIPSGAVLVFDIELLEIR